MLPSNFERGMNDAMALSRGGSGWNCDAITNILIDVRSYNAHSARENAANVQAQSFNDVVFDMSCMVMHLVLGCNLLHMESQAVILICWYEPDLFVLNSRRCLFISIDSVSPEAKWLERLWDLTYLCAPIWGKMESHTHTHMQPATKPCWTQGCLVSCDSRDPTLCGQGRLRLIALHVYWNLIKLHSPNKNTCMQEMEWQGMGPMKGLCDSLKRSGTHGRHPQNIKRDMLRTLGNRNPSCTVPGQNLLEECAELNCKTKWFWCICKM